ncbi:MAG: hypothetical protein BWX86_01544 [Verrucomicrobia bacterium ADurb.Bin122]|nr:MAG: hypothetical protein BWX86_01544 [Verrucomicrobia bacterium ADurb.Bin122]
MVSHAKQSHAAHLDGRQRPIAAEEAARQHGLHADDARDGIAGGSAENFGDGAVLQQPARLHDRERIAQGEDFVTGVTHQNHRDSQLVADAAQVRDDRGFAGGVEGGERLVEQQQAGRGDEGACECHALPLAAGERLHGPSEQGRDAEQTADVRTAGGTALTGGASLGKAQVALDAEMGKQGAVLRHKSDLARLGWQTVPGGSVGEALCAEANPACERSPKSSDEFDERGFAGAGGAEKSGDAAGEGRIGFEQESTGLPAQAFEDEGRLRSVGVWRRWRGGGCEAVRRVGVGGYGGCRRSPA